MAKRNKLKIKKIKRFILYFFGGCSAIIMFSLFMMLPLKVIIDFDIIVYEHIIYSYFLPAFFCIGIPSAILLELWGRDVLNHKAKALQYKINFDNFNELSSYIKSKLLESEYSLISSIKKDNIEEFVYVKEIKETFVERLLASNRKEREFYIIIKVSEITKEFEESIDLELFKLMSKYYCKSVVTDGFYKNCSKDLALKYFDSYGCEVIRDEVYMNLILCVDKENENFRNLMNTKIEIGINTYFLSTGVVLGKNKLYISKCDMNGYYTGQKKAFMKMMNLSNDKKIK